MDISALIFPSYSIYVGISFSHDSHHAWDIPVYSFGYNFSINEFQFMGCS